MLLNANCFGLFESFKVNLIISFLGHDLNSVYLWHSGNKYLRECFTPDPPIIEFAQKSEGKSEIRQSRDFSAGDWCGIFGMGSGHGGSYRVLFSKADAED